MQEQNDDINENTSDSTRDQKESRNARWIKKFILVTIMTFMISAVAGLFTFMEAGLPILALNSINVRNVFTPGDTRIITFNNFFISSVSISYIAWKPTSVSHPLCQ